MWMIDDSGKREEVISRVTALKFEDYIARAAKAEDDASAHVKVERTKAVNDSTRVLEDKLEKHAITKMRLDFLSDAAQKAAFERARTYVLGELKAGKTAFAGVTVRPMPHPDGVGGMRLSVDISEYDRL